MTTNYVMGIDVGSYSAGLAAIEVDENGMPVGYLSGISHIHDSGLDPDFMKSARTRMDVSGVARRTRRLFRRRKKRYAALDRFLVDQGWIVKDFEEFGDPYFPWKVRAELATAKITSSEELGIKLAAALRHIARHRGWKNPYQRISVLHSKTKPSDAFDAIRKEVEKATGRPVPEDFTVGQMISTLTFGQNKLRGEGGVLSARLQQSDHANEILVICEKQGIDLDIAKQIIDKVFAAESPKGANLSRVGSDPLQPSQPRALKATDAFQRYRLLALIGNLRIRDEQDKRALTLAEKVLVFDFLIHHKHTQEPNWLDICEILEIDRGRLLGTALMTDDGERAGNRPPVHDTNRSVLSSRIPSLVSWWKEATEASKAVMVKALSNAEMEDFDSPEGTNVQAFFASLSDEEQEKLDTLHLPIGRAAYSESTLVKLAEHMHTHGTDLYEARRAVFNVESNWVPPAPRIGEPVGNPAVDRVLKQVSRWIEACIDTYGLPKSVNIEHVREAFSSEAKTREIERGNQRRENRNLAILKEMYETLGIKGRVRRADLWQHQSVQRQNGQCAYCGETITFLNSEMDHIVPRAGEGSTNTRENLLAVCHRCNVSKSKMSFAAWAPRSSIEGVSFEAVKDRIRHWNADPGLSSKEFAKFKTNVLNRLSRTADDEPIDARSIESVAWMANELRSRISQRINQNPSQQIVHVYKGAITHEARHASGLERQIEYIGGRGKTRLDRRHHIVDASVIAFMTPYVAEVLAQRSSHRFDQELRKKNQTWKEFTGGDQAHRIEFAKWNKKMQQLSKVINAALHDDELVVTSNLRLRLGSGAVHEDTVRPLQKVQLGLEISAEQVNRAASEALWCALTRHPDYDKKKGLPASESREIQVNGKRYSADDWLDFFPVKAGSLAVRGGYVELGSTFHHARLYKWNSGKKTTFAILRVYRTDLARYRNTDLFEVKLLPQMMSVRAAPQKLRDAIENGTAEYLGWLVTNDELVIHDTSFGTAKMQEVQHDFGMVKRWRLDGFYDENRLRLRPLHISSEGLREPIKPAHKEIIDRKGWVIGVNSLFNSSKVEIIRRDALGRPRESSNAHLPTSWEV